MTVCATHSGSPRDDLKVVYRGYKVLWMLQNGGMSHRACRAVALEWIAKLEDGLAAQRGITRS